MAQVYLCVRACVHMYACVYGSCVQFVNDMEGDPSFVCRIASPLQLPTSIDAKEQAGVALPEAGEHKTDQHRHLQQRPKHRPGKRLRAPGHDVELSRVWMSV